MGGGMSRVVSNTFVTEGSSALDVIAIGTLVVAILALLWTAYWNRRSERRSYLDEFWFRQVVAPKCIDPVLSLNDVWAARVDNVTAANVTHAFVMRFLSDFQNDKAKVIGATWVSRIFKSGFYARCCDSLDQVEDVFAREFDNIVTGRQSLDQAKASMKFALGGAAIDILSDAAKMHGGTLQPRQNSASPRRSLWRALVHWLSGMRS